jgi:hypothetical protein
MSAVELRPERPDEGRDDSSDRPPVSNDQVDWDRFDSEAYFAHNYRGVRADDRQIMEIIRDFFAGQQVDPQSRAVDVGTGTNLYPAFAMLPFCAHLDLWERSASNVAWIRGQITRFDDNWLDFWDVYRPEKAYELVADPRAALAARAEVHRASVFELPSRKWDLGTMFFVACSMSADVEEFQHAVRAFVTALKPGAPFAAAFMAQSQGYQVGDRWFPAVAIDTEEVTRALAPVALDTRISRIALGDPLRDGYSGMLVATGRSAPPN